MLEIVTLTITPFQQNCRLVINTDSSYCIVLDPGGESGTVLREISSRKLIPQAILLTHSHIDHAGGVQEILTQYPVPLLGHEGDREFRERLSEQAVYFGLDPAEYRQCPEPNRYLRGGEREELAGLHFEVRFTPGHAPGHLVFSFDEQELILDGCTLRAPLLLAGDTLFAGSIGRTDLPGGDHKTLIDSIERQILTLPGDTVVLPGHGPATTVSKEKQQNPFLGGR